MKKHKIILLLVSFIAMIVIANFIYIHLKEEYTGNQLESGDTGNKTAEKDETDEKDESEAEENKAEENKAADFKVYDEDGNEVRLSDYMGKPLVVNFWASWCPPCKREMPYFQKMTEQYGQEVTFLMINETDGDRETKENAQAFIKDNGYNMKVLFDQDQDAANAYYIFYLPRTLFIDKNGNIIEDHSGEISEEELETKIKELY